MIFAYISSVALCLELFFADYLNILVSNILIDGRFEYEKTDYSRAWVGSSNQNYYFFTDRYDESVITECKNKIEVRISPDNRVIMTGMGNFSELVEAMR